MLFELRLNRGDHPRRTMADIQAADAAGKIQIAVAIHVLIVAPSARAAKTGVALEDRAELQPRRRAINARDFGQEFPSSFELSSF